MARISTSGGWSQANDAAFRTWLGECEQMLEDCGLVRTNDTGQIDPMSATIPAANNSDSGYSIWRFDDSLQSVAPIFIKIIYGRGGGGASTLRFRSQIGTGSDGAGNLTGAVTSLSTTPSGSTPGSGTYNSFAIHREGYAALAFKVGGISATFAAGAPAFIVQRTCDNAGIPTADGAVLIAGVVANNTSSAGQTARVRFLPTPDVADMRSAVLLGMYAGGLSDSRVGLAPQVFTHWTALPEQRPLVGSCSYMRGEIGQEQQFAMALVGTTPRNYLAVDGHFGNTLTAEGNVGTAILWED